MQELTINFIKTRLFSAVKFKALKYNFEQIIHANFLVLYLNEFLKRVCYKGKCVSKRSLNIPICDKAKCRSAGGKCVNDPFKITNQFKMMNIDIQQSTELPSLARFMPLQNDDSSITTTSSSYNTFEWEWIEYNNNWYFYNSLYLVHSAAERYCNLFDATLAEITDFDQLKFLANNVMFENYFAWVTIYK